MSEKTLEQTLESLGRAIAEKKEKQPEQEPTKAGPVVQLDFWEDGRRAAPNAVFRSALFPALNNQTRTFVKKKELFAVEGVKVNFTGEQFDQTDLDVYLELLNLARPFPLGTPVKFTAHALLKALGKKTVGSSDYDWLHAVITRLTGGVVDLRNNKKRYFGSLLEGGKRDEITLEYEIRLNPEFAALFGFGMWATLDHAQRQAIGRNQTAKSLHAYYSSHAAPSAHKIETLANVAGVQGKNKKSTVVKAHDVLKSDKVGFLEDYEVLDDKIKATIKKPTRGQIRHIAKKSATRRPKGTEKDLG
jgi:TrfA protein